MSTLTSVGDSVSSLGPGDILAEKILCSTGPILSVRLVAEVTDSRDWRLKVGVAEKIPGNRKWWQHCFHVDKKYKVSALHFTQEIAWCSFNFKDERHVCEKTIAVKWGCLHCLSTARLLQKVILFTCKCTSVLIIRLCALSLRRAGPPLL